MARPRSAFRIALGLAVITIPLFAIHLVFWERGLYVLAGLVVWMAALVNRELGAAAPERLGEAGSHRR